jgi:hypothetical protein
MSKWKLWITRNTFRSFLIIQQITMSKSTMTYATSGQDYLFFLILTVRTRSLQTRVCISCNLLWICWSQLSCQRSLFKGISGTFFPHLCYLMSFIHLLLCNYYIISVMIMLYYVTILEMQFIAIYDNDYILCCDYI